MDELDRLIQMFKSGANALPSSKFNILLDIQRYSDPRIVPFLLQVLSDANELREVRIDVLKQLRHGPVPPEERLEVAHSVTRLLLGDTDPCLRLEATQALGAFADTQGVASTLGSIALDIDEPLELRYSAFISLQRGGATPESVRLVRQLRSDEALGRAAGALLSTWRRDA